jgi:hypothetical protein
MANERESQIVRQNQTQNVRELLKAKGYLPLVSTYEFMVYVELWTDYCLTGPTKEIKERFKAFDNILQQRIKESQLEVDGIIM